MVKSVGREQTSCGIPRPRTHSSSELYFLLILALSMNFSGAPAVQAEPRSPPSKASALPSAAWRRKRQDLDGERGVMSPDPSVTAVTQPLSSPSLAPPPTPAAALTCKSGHQNQKTSEGGVAEEVKETRSDVTAAGPPKKPLRLDDDDDDLPPAMMSRRVALLSEETESSSMSDILNEDEVGHLPSLSQSRYERMQEQYSSFVEDEDHWQNDLVRWKNRRRSASQDLIKKEEERKRLEKRLKDAGSDGNKRKSIKTYKEIVEDKERREAELCEDYRNAATPEEAAMILQRYALRFTISDATLDSLKLPRSTSKSQQDPDHVDKEPKPASLINESETSEPHEPEPTLKTDQTPANPEEVETAVQQETPASVSPSRPAPSSPLGPTTESEDGPPQPLQRDELQSEPTGSPSKHAPPQSAQVQPPATQPVHSLPSLPPSVAPRPVPLLAAKPYCQPRNAQPGHKPVKMDGLVRVNGEAPEEPSVSAPGTSAQLSPKATEDVPLKAPEEQKPSEQAATREGPAEQTPPPQAERSTSSSGSAISSLIGGRSCIITTTIVTELTQTHVEPRHPDAQSNGQVNGASLSERLAASPNSMQEFSPTGTGKKEGLEESDVTIETPMLNLAKRVNHWVWDPNEERKRLESWQQEQERLLQEQYQREQEKLKKEWEKAQLEVEEEERKHNEEERRILEETATPLTPTGVLNQHSGQAGAASSGPESNTKRGSVSPQKNGQRISSENEDQHVSKLHFLQDSASDSEPSKRQELLKTASLDRNPQLAQAQFVQRSESHNALMSKPQSCPSSSQPPSPSRCVSGKRLCSGCSQQLGKGAAMIIDTLGLFFHMQCFKCGVCKGQLGDATAGTDVRIRNGLLSCHDCYIASRDVAGRWSP